MSISDLPEWLLGGVALGAVLTVLVAAIFLLGERAFARDAPSGSHVAGDERRRQELRRYLDAIGERYVEDRSIEGIVVEFYLPERDVAITFDAEAFFGLEEATTDVVLCEHEMRGSHLGARLPFETPDLGAAAATAGDAAASRGPRWSPEGGSRRSATDGPKWASGSGRDGGRTRRGSVDDDRREVAAAFDVLGLTPDADLEAIRRAYRRQVKEVHPDHGGDQEQFRRVQEAYEAARDHAD